MINESVIHAIEEINEKIKTKCQNCRVSIMQEPNMNITGIVHYGTTITETSNPVLCFYHNDRCISSLLISIIYDSSIDKKIISFSVKTDQQYENKKIYKLLVSILIIIAKLIDDKIDILSINVQNPISAYVLMNHFNGKLFAFYSENQLKDCEINDDDDDYIDDADDADDVTYHKLPFSEQITLDNITKAINKFHNCIKEINCDIEINDTTKEKAEELIQEIISSLSITGGNKSRKRKIHNKRKSKSKSKRKYKKR